MRYNIVGVGGTGGAIGGFLALAEKDIALVAREPHRTWLATEGLRLHSEIRGNHRLLLPAFNPEEKRHDADVVFVCVKSYGLEEATVAVNNAARPNALVIPILNPFGAGERLAAALPHLRVLEGRIYIQAFKEEDGSIRQQGRFFKIVFGPLTGGIHKDMQQVAADLQAAGIQATVSPDIRREAFKKFSYISPCAAAGAYFGANAAMLRENDHMRAFFIGLSEEIVALGAAMGISLPANATETHCEILADSAPEATTSLQRDIEAGNDSEIDGLIGEVLRLAERYGLEVPHYRAVAQKLQPIVEPAKK